MDEEEKRWGLLQRRVIGDGYTTYMVRITLLLTPWFSVKLHRIYRPDGQRELHDHPWAFLSILLWGAYAEDVPHSRADFTPVRQQWIHWWNWKAATDAHSIRELSRRPVWTLVLTGPKRRTWGFYVDGGAAWVPFDEYEKLNDA